MNESTPLAIKEMAPNALQKEGLKKLAQFIVDQKWNEQDFRFLLNYGKKFSVVSNQIFDQVFCLPETNSPYSIPEKEQWNTRTYRLIKRLDQEISNLAKLFTTSQGPWAYVATQTGSGRVRIPIHAHRKRNRDDRTEFTLTIAMYLAPTSANLTKFRFFQPVPPVFQEGYTREDLKDTAEFQEFEVPPKVSAFIFSGSNIPHTVQFSENFCLFAVMNNINYLDLQSRLDKSSVLVTTAE